jgi:hypothetical protein
MTLLEKMVAKEKKRNKRIFGIYKIVDGILSENLFKNQTLLIDHLLEKGIFHKVDITNLFDENGQEKEIYHWRLVYSGMAEKLIEIKEPIIKSRLGTWWGQTNEETSVKNHPVIVAIAEEIYDRMNIKEKRRIKND